MSEKLLTEVPAIVDVLNSGSYSHLEAGGSISAESPRKEKGSNHAPPASTPSAAVASPRVAYRLPARGDRIPRPRSLGAVGRRGEARARAGRTPRGSRRGCRPILCLTRTVFKTPFYRAEARVGHLVADAPLSVPQPPGEETQPAAELFTSPGTQGRQWYRFPRGPDSPLSRGLLLTPDAKHLPRASRVSGPSQLAVRDWRPRAICNERGFSLGSFCIRDTPSQCVTPAVRAPQESR